MNMPERVRANTNTQALPEVWLTGKEVNLNQVYVPRLKKSDWTLITIILLPTPSQLTSTEYCGTTGVKSKQGNRKKVVGEEIQRKLERLEMEEKNN